VATEALVMGWRPLQWSIDQSARKTDKLISQIDKLNKLFENFGKQFQKIPTTFMSWGAKGAPGQPQSNLQAAITAMYGGKGLGGHVKGLTGYGSSPAAGGAGSWQGGGSPPFYWTAKVPPGGTPQQPGSLLARAGNGGHGGYGGGGGLPPGGGFPALPPGGSSGGSLINLVGNGGHSRAALAGYIGTTAVLSGVSALRRFGERERLPQMLMELAAASASLGSGLPYSQASQTWLRNVFGPHTAARSATALSLEDTLAAEFLRMRVSGGWSLNTARDRSVDAAWRALAMINSTMGDERSMRVIAELLSPRVANRARLLGYGELFTRDHAYIGNAEFVRRLFRRTFGTDRVDPQRVQAALAQGQPLYFNLRALGLSDEAVEALAEYARAYATATSSGLSGEEFDRLLVQAAQTGPQALRARETLQRYNIPVDTVLQQKKDIQAIERSFDAELNKEFIESWKAVIEETRQGTEAINSFRKALEDATGILSKSGGLWEFLRRPLRTILGWLNWGEFDTGSNQQPTSQSAQNVLDLVRRTGQYSNANDMRNRHSTSQGGESLLSSALSSSRKSDQKPKGTDKKNKGSGDRIVQDKKTSRNQDDVIGGASTIARVINYARAQIGKWYQWGGAGPDRFDCSGLVWMAYKTGANINIGRTTWDQLRNPKAQNVPISRKAVLPGDLIYTNAGGHVSLWTGGSYIEAPGTGKRIREVRAWPSGIHRILRFIRSSGPASNGIGAAEFKQQQEEVEKLPTEQTGTGGDEVSGDPITGNVVFSVANQLGSVEEIDIVEAIFGSNSPLRSYFINVGGESTQHEETKESTREKPKKEKTKKDTGAAQIPEGEGLLPGKAGKGVRGKIPPLPKSARIRRNIKLGKEMSYARGWTDANDEWDALYMLWMKESGWNDKARNPSSGAYGIPQANPAPGSGHKVALDPKWQNSPRAQIEWGLNYIAQRYGTPKRAWSHHLAKNWYDRGAWEIPHDQPAVVHKGEMIIPAKQAEKIRDVLLRENVSHNTTTNNTNHNITFGPNSIQITINANPNSGGNFGTRQAARQLARDLMQEIDRLLQHKRIAQGM